MSKITQQTFISQTILLGFFNRIGFRESLCALQLRLPPIPYYWVVAGMLSQKLVFLCQKIEAVDVAPGFKQVAPLTWLLWITSMRDSLSHRHPWVYRAKKSIPYSNGNCTWNEGIVVGNEDGEALTADVGVGDEDAYVYIMGRCIWESQSGAALSRILHDDFLRFPYNENSTKFEYLAIDGTWTAAFLLSNLKMLFPSVFSEGNLIYNKFLNSWYVLLCQAFDPVVHIALSNSKSLYKDTTWSVQDFYNIPPKYLNKSDQLISYASKSHPEYAPNGNDQFIVFSFNTNTLAVKKLDNLTYIYHPHFVQIDLMTHKLISQYRSFKDDVGENKHYKLRRRHILSPIRDNIAAEMGVLPADDHHRETKGDTGASSAIVAPEAKEAPDELSTQKKKPVDEKHSGYDKTVEKGPSHGAIAVSDIALGISAMNGHVTENTNDCNHKGGIATLLCHKSKQVSTKKIESQDSSSPQKAEANKASSSSQDSGANTGQTFQEKHLEKTIDHTTVHDIAVKVETTKGWFMITVKPKWSPQGAAQFLSLVASGFYENIAIFRVLPGFVAQFGINGNPKIQKAYGSSIPDDPPAHVSNALGTLSFAAHGPNTRSTQVFFNTMDNARLDAMNFQPFAVVEKKGIPIITSFFENMGKRLIKVGFFKRATHI